MDKEQAIAAMQKGKKVTHRYFSSNEWMTMENGMIVTEEGYKNKPFVFWKFRQGPSWEDGYSLYEPKTI